LISQHFNSLVKEYFEANTNVSFPKKYFNEIFKVKMDENSIDNSVSILNVGVALQTFATDGLIDQQV
jgi:hypothetical protein